MKSQVRQGRAAMWWKLGGLGLATVVALAMLLLTPLANVRMTVELPTAGAAPKVTSSSSDVLFLPLIADLACLVVVLGGAAWMARRIVRRQRKIEAGEA